MEIIAKEKVRMIKNQKEESEFTKRVENTGELI